MAARDASHADIVRDFGKIGEFTFAKDEKYGLGKFPSHAI